MKKTSHSLDAQAAEAIEALSQKLGVSRAEIVRRCTVAMQRQAENGSLPPVVEEGYSESEDDRTKRGAVGKNGTLGRAPSLGDLDDLDSGEDANESVASTSNGSPESSQRGSDDQDGEGKSFLDKRLW